MKNRKIVMAALIFCMTSTGFGINKNDADVKSEVQKKSKSGQASAYLEKGAHKGKVLTTMNSGGYTYIEFEEEGKTYWAAAPEFQVAAGDTVEFEGALPMKDFRSKTLNRTFELIYFINVVRVGDAPPGQGKTTELPAGHAPVQQSKNIVTVEPGSIEKAPDGFTIAECFLKKNSLNGKAVKIRGRVVKFTAKIMGKNWLHIQDGTGQEGMNDLTVTTKQQAQTGDLILVSGKLAMDKDLGSGYFYTVIIEDALIVVESDK
jgi:hypothetical protein